MPVRADIYQNAGLPQRQFENRPFAGLDSLVKMQEQQQVLQQQRLKTEAMQRAADEELAFNQILQSSDGDWENTYSALLRSAPSLAPKYMESVQREREVRFKAMQEETAAELAEAQYGLRSLQVMIDAPELAPDLLPGLAKRVPELAPVLQKLPPPDDPRFSEAVKALQQYGLSAKEQIEREDKWNQAFLKGDFRYAGEVLSQADNPQEAAQILHEAGMPKAAVQAMLADPSAWRMTAEERSQEENRAARLKEEERQNREQIAATQRGQDLGAATTRRGQDIQAATTRRGQDLSEGVETVLGADGKPTIVRRSQAVGRQPVPGTGAMKPSTGAEKRALNFFNRAKQASDELERLEPTVAAMGYWDQERMKRAPNFAQTQTGQAFNAAQAAFTEARLRKDSGAAIPPFEFENDRRMYFPQPGDSKETITQKARMRAGVLASLAFESGNALPEFYGDEAQTLIENYKQKSAGANPSPGGGEVRVGPYVGRVKP